MRLAMIYVVCELKQQYNYLKFEKNINSYFHFTRIIFDRLRWFTKIFVWIFHYTVENVYNIMLLRSCNTYVRFCRRKNIFEIICIHGQNIMIQIYYFF